MSVQLISPDTWRTQAWKNGGGITHEIVREEDDAGLVWRLSVAEVASDGPFSRFEGVDRIICLLQGNGFRLRDREAAITIDSPLQSYAFAGEDTIHCELLNGPVRDFNLMLHRNRCRGDQQCLRLDATPCSVASTGTLHIVFIVTGRVHAVTPNGIAELADNHCLIRRDPQDPLCLAAPDGSATVISININYNL